jgi:hypothetical protein
MAELMARQGVSRAIGASGASACTGPLSSLLLKITDAPQGFATTQLISIVMLQGSAGGSGMPSAEDAAAEEERKQ